MSLNAPNITNKRLDPALIRREFLAYRRLTCTILMAQLPRVVFDAPRRFEIRVPVLARPPLSSLSP